MQSFHHFLGQSEAYGHLGGAAGSAGSLAASLGHAFGGLKFDIVIEVADDGHAGAFVDSGLDLWRHRDIFHGEAGDFDAVFAGNGWINQWQQGIAELAVARGYIEGGQVGGGEGVGEHADDARAHGVGEFIEAEIVIGTGDFFEEDGHIDHAKVIGAESAQPDDTEVGIAEHDGVAGTPFVAGEEPGIDVVNVTFERRLKAVFPSLEA